MNSGQQPWTSNSPRDAPTPDSPPPEKQPNPQGRIPPWAWIFAVGCGIIPVLTLGGVLPSAIGAGGAFSCINIARDETRPINSRLGICAAITVVCWVLFLLLMGGVARLQGR
ncbi:MAG TPA: hypothetical protein VF600_03750 [Abditibacteriaceae bacterium]|jgi:hypothetical protein